MLLVIGIDVGRAVAKAVSTRRESMPSYVSPAQETDLECGTPVLIDGEEWLVGAAAADMGAREFGKGKATHRNTRILALALAASLGDRYDTCVIGLPICDYRRQAQAIERRLAGTHEVKLSGRSVRLHIIKAVAFPEGAGAGWTCLDSDATVGIIDIGWQTLNFCALRKGGYVDSMSGTLPLGLSEAWKAYYKRVSRVRHISPHVAASELSRSASDLQQLAGRIRDELLVWWPDPESFDRVVLAGGGGAMLAEHLAWPRAQLHPDPHWANAGGFYRVAQQLCDRS